METWSEARGRTVVYERSQGRCEVCTRKAAEWHHRANRSQGGTWSPSNGLHLCSWCHRWITEHPRHSRALGIGSLAVDPVDVPMYVRPTAFWRGWWHADDEGMWHWLDDNAPPDDEPRRAAVAALTAARLTWV